MNFSIINQFFLFVGVQNFPFDNLAQKAHPPKHYKNRGFSNPFFWNRFASRHRHFWTKPKPEVPVIIFAGPRSSLSTTKTQTCSETPIFIVFFASAKIDTFQNLNLKVKTQKTEI